ncbi:hypothetical protein MJO29_012360 [Puccinia striiformis f. sp. tritici]|nr:hypothetical protein MJO29_012360 [Puccinia striiformis f. sp. tritici]
MLPVSITVPYTPQLSPTSTCESWKNTPIIPTLNFNQYQPAHPPLHGGFQPFYPILAPIGLVRAYPEVQQPACNTGPPAATNQNATITTQSPAVYTILTVERLNIKKKFLCST